MASEPERIYCITLRVRRILHEDAYINVPVTDAILERRDDGSLRISADAMVAEAIRLSGDPAIDWEREECRVEAHPIQQPKPDDRPVFEAHR